MLVLALSYGEQVLLLSPKIVYHWLTALLPSGQVVNKAKSSQVLRSRVINQREE